MDVARQWFEDASLITNVHKDFNEEFLIYKGFKITKRGGSYRVQDVRHSEFYSPLSSKDREVIEQYGFVRGVDEINYTLNLLRLEEYHERLKALKLKEKLAREELKKGIDKRLNIKRIRLAKENTLEYQDLIQLAESRIKQYNFKHN